MGMPIDTKVSLSDDLETLWGLQSNDELMATELDLDNNLAYDLIKQDIVMHGYLVKLEEAKYYPRLNAFFDYKQQAFRDKFDFFDFSNLGIRERYGVLNSVFLFGITLVDWQASTKPS